MYQHFRQDYRSLRLLSVVDGQLLQARLIWPWREPALALFNVDLLDLFPKQTLTENWRPNEKDFAAVLAPLKEQCRAILDQAFADPAFLAWLQPQMTAHDVVLAETRFGEAGRLHLLQIADDSQANPEYQRYFQASLLLGQLRAYLSTDGERIYAHGLEAFLQDALDTPNVILGNDMYTPGYETIFSEQNGSEQSNDHE